MTPRKSYAHWRHIPGDSPEARAIELARKHRKLLQAAQAETVRNMQEAARRAAEAATETGAR